VQVADNSALKAARAGQEVPFLQPRMALWPPRLGMGGLSQGPQPATLEHFMMGERFQLGTPSLVNPMRGRRPGFGIGPLKPPQSFEWDHHPTSLPAHHFQFPPFKLTQPFGASGASMQDHLSLGVPHLRAPAPFGPIQHPSEPPLVRGPVPHGLGLGGMQLRAPALHTFSPGPMLGAHHLSMPAFGSSLAAKRPSLSLGSFQLRPPSL